VMHRNRGLKTRVGWDPETNRPMRRGSFSAAFHILAHRICSDGEYQKSSTMDLPMSSYRALGGEFDCTPLPDSEETTDCNAMLS
jgi:hypothetical protein